MLNPWLGILLVLGVLGGLFVGLSLLRRLAAPHPELLRKLMHMGMGLVTLLFPWLFEDAWPVLVLAGISVVLLASLRLVSSLKSGLGQIVGGVERFSLGEIYFPVAVMILFLLYLREDPSQPNRRIVLYCVPILLLGLADAVAALVGIGYGRLRYPTADGEKSIEGSVAFFTMAFFCIHVPLLLFMPEVKGPETLLISVLLAWLAMMFEAIAWRGLDNLVLPLVSFLLLRIYLGASLRELEERLGVTLSMMAVVFLYHRQSTLLGSALLGASLMGYASWALGGWRWLPAPMILFLTYTFLSPRTPDNSKRVHNIHAVVSVSSGGFFWLILATIMGRDDFLLPYTLAFAAHLAIIGIARLSYDYPQMSGPGLLTICVFKGFLFIFAPYLLIEGLSDDFTLERVSAALICLPGVVFAACAFYWLQPGIDDCPLDTARWLRQATFAGIGSAFALVPLLSFNLEPTATTAAIRSPERAMIVNSVVITLRVMTSPKANASE